MYQLDRTKKIIKIMFCISAISFILTFWGYAGGGYDLLNYGMFNDPEYIILMFSSAGVFILSLLTGLGFKALSKDIAEQLKFLESIK